MSAGTVSGDNNGNLVYALSLQRLYENSEPILLDSWTIDWGDGSSPQTYAVTDVSVTLDVSHTYATGIDSPVVQVSAVTQAYGNIIPLKLMLPPANMPPVVGLTATESNAGEVDLSWMYDTDLAASFTCRRGFGSRWTVWHQNTGSVARDVYVGGFS